MKFIQRLLCRHYWDIGSPMIDGEPLGLLKHRCVKCGKEKIKVWPWAIHENVWKHHA